MASLAVGFLAGSMAGGLMVALAPRIRSIRQPRRSTSKRLAFGPSLRRRQYQH